MVRSPEIAHKNWPKLSEKERAAILKKMREVYNEDWVDEFLTLQENGYRGEGATVSHLSDKTSPPAPASEELERLGYVRIRNYEYPLGFFLRRGSGLPNNYTCDYVNQERTSASRPQSLKMRATHRKDRRRRRRGGRRRYKPQGSGRNVSSKFLDSCERYN
jgi:hypothetical protein